MKMQLPGRVAGMIVLLMLCVGAASAQTPSAPNASQPAGQEAPKEGMPVALTLKRAIELALQNSKEIQVAKIQASVADRAAQITKAQFMPNLMRVPAPDIRSAYRKRQADVRLRSSMCLTRNKFSTNHCAARRKRRRSRPKHKRLCWRIQRTA